MSQSDAVWMCPGCGWADDHAEGCSVASAEALGLYDAEDFEPDDLNDSNDWEWSPDHEEGA